MVIDSSAIVAIAFSEAEAESFEQLISNDPVRPLSAATLLEVPMVIEARLGDAGGQVLEDRLYRTAADVVSVDVIKAEIARSAWRRFGKGRHSAGLNYGDCFPMPLRSTAAKRCFSKATIFLRRMSSLADSQLASRLRNADYTRSRNRL